MVLKFDGLVCFLCVNSPFFIEFKSSVRKAFIKVQSGKLPKMFMSEFICIYLC